MTAIQRKTEWFKPIDPYEFQWDIFEKTIAHICTTSEPGYIYASVSAGKTIMQAMLAKNGQMVAELANKQQLKMLFLARTGELVEQNSEEMWGMAARNSVFSASLGLKRAEYPVIVGSEGTVCRSLFTALKNFVPDILLIDECLTGESLIRTEHGEVKIKDLDRTKRIYCISEETGELFLDYPVRVFSNGIRNISRVITSEGELRCTSTHKLLSNGSWLPAGSLTAGQSLTLDGSQDFVLKKLLRASVAVAGRLCQTLRPHQKSSRMQ